MQNTPMQNTHRALSSRLCGEARELSIGSARVEWTALEEMRADERGLVHGGFVFGVADYAAMLAINDPLVVLGAAEVRFLRPVVVGDRLWAEACEQPAQGKKRMVVVEVKRDAEVVMSGTFTCFVPTEHVLGPIAGAS